MPLRGSSANNLRSLSNVGNNTLMGLNVMLHTSETSLSIESLYGEPVVCISVIDESTGTQAYTDYYNNTYTEGDPTPINSTQVLELDWNSFRENYPNRPFYLLQPAEDRQTKNVLQIPAGVVDNDPVAGLFYSEVNRDNGSPSSISNWFTICGLSTYPPDTLISLFIDTSGSMDLSTVQASYDKFLADCQNVGLIVAGNSQNQGERWAVDHNKPFSELIDLVTVVRVLDETVPFYNDGVFLEALQDSLVSKKIGDDLERFPNLYAYMGQKGRNSTAGAINIINPDGNLTITNSFMRGESTGSSTKTNWVNDYYSNVNSHTINVCNITENIPNGQRLIRPDTLGLNSADVHGNIFSIFTTPNTIKSQIPGFFGEVLSSNTRRECYTLVITNSPEQIDGPDDLLGDRILVNNPDIPINPGLNAVRYAGYLGNNVNYDRTAQLDTAVSIGYSEPVVCISVIDESNQLIPVVGSPQDAQQIQTDWNSFRANYPNRPFYLLQPIGNVTTDASKNNEKSDVKIPTGVVDNDPLAGLFYSQVNRDEGNISNASDWFGICGLSTYPPKTAISLSIDDSGSMNLSTVQASYDKFLADCQNAGLIVKLQESIRLEYDGNGERWAEVHNLPQHRLGFPKTYPNPMSLIEIDKFFAGVNTTDSTFFNNKTWVISGLFKAPKTGSYRFKISSDDASYLWINRTENFTESNALIQNGGLHTLQTAISSPISLVQGVYYPIKIIYGNRNAAPPSLNPTELTLEWNIDGGSYTSDGTNILFNTEVATELRGIIDGPSNLGEINFRRYRIIALSTYTSTDGYDGVLFYGNDYSQPYAYIKFTGTNTNDYTITRSSTAPNWTKGVNQKQDTLTIAMQSKGGLFKISNVYGTNDYRRPFAEVISQFMEDTLN